MHAKLHVSFSTIMHLDVLEMVQSVRLNDQEQEMLRKKAVELNKVLIQKGQQPLRDSELVHILIEEGLELIEVGSSGKAIIPR
jgi:hypothetical protein